MKTGVVTSLKCLIGLFIAILLATALWWIPWVANDSATLYPEFAHLKIPLLALAEAALAFILAFLVAIWALLTRVREGQVFSTSSFKWVKVLTLTPLGVALACIAAVPLTPGPPLLVYGALLAAIACIAISLLMAVMRGLLEQALALQGELDEVI
ncbi:MAG: DUF2975 domain-containing protein [Ancrocorticia sp.]|uniref:DUF2975 domain-containing protein n=1 Tax=Ancrocorticia sp. TaxID=2593684 RepID=UPI003F91244E